MGFLPSLSLTLARACRVASLNPRIYFHMKWIWTVWTAEVVSHFERTECEYCASFHRPKSQNKANNNEFTCRFIWLFLLLLFYFFFSYFFFSYFFLYVFSFARKEEEIGFWSNEKWWAVILMSKTAVWHCVCTVRGSGFFSVPYFVFFSYGRWPPMLHTDLNVHCPPFHGPRSHIHCPRKKNKRKNGASTA